MPRWRFEAWGLIGLGVGFLLVVAAPYVLDPCGGMPYGSERTACAMGGGLFFAMIIGGAFIVWLVGSIVLLVSWLVRRHLR
jgi:hypothetical protein